MLVYATLPTRLLALTFWPLAHTPNQINDLDRSLNLFLQQFSRFVPDSVLWRAIAPADKARTPRQVAQDGSGYASPV